VIQNLKNQVRFFVNNKVYMISLILAAIAGYGYEIMHSSMGIDDVCIEIYFEDGLGVAIGRWPFYLINKIFHITDFSPFMLELVSVGVMVIAAILWAALIRSIVSKELPMICYIIFSAMFVDYSLIAEVFVYYLQNGIGIIYALTAISLFVFYDIQVSKRSWKENIPSVAAMAVMMCISISFYESAANVFLFGVLLIMFVDAVSENRMGINKFMGCFWCALLTLRVLVYAILGRSVITKLCMTVFDIEEYNYRSVSSMLWILKYPARVLTLIRQIYRDYFVVGYEYYPIRVFVIATAVFVIGLAYYTLKKKNFYLFLIGLAAYVSLFALSIAQGDAVPYRANQMLSVFVAAVLCMLSYWVMQIPQIWIRSIGLVLVCSLVYNSAFDLNQWFVFEYKRNQLEMEEVHRISYELRSKYDIANKPVVFVGEYVLDEAIQREYSLDETSPAYEKICELNTWMGMETPALYPYTQVLSYSFLNWSITSFSIYEGYNREINRLFEKEGLSLIWGGNEYYQKGLELMEDLNRYPVDGYIKEYEDFILVRF